MLSDFPKIECPFIRVLCDVNVDDWKNYGRQLNMREPRTYLAVNSINPGYEWVFDDPDTIAVEKLNGSNVKIRTENNRLVEVQNRKNIIDPLKIDSKNTMFLEGLITAISRKKIQSDGEQAGELIGPKIQANPYYLQFHEWYSFKESIASLRYKSFHDHDRTFDNWSSWFKDYLFSLFYRKKRPRLHESPDKIMAEGVVFYNLKRKEQGETYRAKLRRDMFPWFYENIEIYDYDKNLQPEQIKNTTK